MTARKPRPAQSASVVTYPSFDPYTYTDEGNASRFLTTYGKNLRFDHTSAKWYGSGILNRLIAACLRWQREGLTPPECVQATSGQYRTESNPISPFLETRCDYDPAIAKTATEGIAPTPLWEAYAAYMRDARQTPIADIRTFKSYMEAFGFEQGKVGAKGRFWRGVTLLSGDPQVEVE